MSTNRIKGSDGVIIESTKYLELPKAPTKQTPEVRRAGMIRFNKEWASFEGALEFTDGTVAYRRFANLDENGKLLTSQLPDSVTSGMRYVGTYSPISDDIDPPITPGVFDVLPIPTDDNMGDYFITRGLLDTAMQHYKTNTPSTSPVIFTPVNPSGAGNWIQIKYYFSGDPVTPSTNIVIAAFGRILVDQIPSSGHAGLLSLSTDSVLTAAFTNDNDSTQEQALSDGDWVISAGKWQRLRNSRVSITASAVIFDRSMMYSYNRVLNDAQSGVVQTVIDSLIMNGLRRTGDAMFDNGQEGDGRLALLYGTANAPALTFNSNPYDPITNPGTDPTKWSDADTGIFHPIDGAIGFSSNGIERLRIEPQILKIMQFNTSSAATAPTIQFIGTGNTNNLGITALNNTFSFSTNNKVQVELTNNLSKFHGAVTIDTTLDVTGKITGNNDLAIAGNSLLGGTLGVTGKITGSSDLQINGNSSIGGTLSVTGKITGSDDLQINGNTILGTDCADTLTVNSASIFNCSTTLNGSVIIGTSCTDGSSFTVNSPSNFNCNVSFGSVGNPNNIGVVSYAPVQFVENTSHTNGSYENYGLNSYVLFTNGTSINTKLSFDIDNIFKFSQNGAVGEYNFILGNLDPSLSNIKLTRYGIKLPVLSPVDNTKGEDGMIAFSAADKRTMQKVDGSWTTIGSTNAVTRTFISTDWVVDGANYSITIPNTSLVLSVSVFELISGNYSPVDVDSVLITSTSVKLSIPIGSTDLRFNGRCVIIVN